VSKKTIAFTMPAAAARPRERTLVDPDALAGESTPFIAPEGQDAGSDDWVRDRSVRIAGDHARALHFLPALPAAAGTSVMIDLASERNLVEVMSLSFFLPFALGWFWFANAMRRRHPLWVE
jgi:hypothetical protein